MWVWVWVWVWECVWVWVWVWVCMRALGVGVGVGVGLGLGLGLGAGATYPGGTNTVSSRQGSVSLTDGMGRPFTATMTCGMRHTEDGGVHHRVANVEVGTITASKHTHSRNGNGRSNS